MEFKKKTKKWTKKKKLIFFSSFAIFFFTLGALYMISDNTFGYKTSLQKLFGDGSFISAQGETNNNTIGYEFLPPTYSNNQTNSTVAGSSTLFSLLVQDDNPLNPNGQYIFSTNNTGTWVNESAVNFTSDIKILGSTTDLTDYQVKVVLDKASLMNADYSDVRFYDVNNTLLNYWIENYTDDNATFWIKVPTLIANINNTISVTYGNSSLTSESNGVNTFLAFNDGTIDVGNTLEDGFTLMDTATSDYPNDIDVYDDGNRILVASYEDDRYELYNSTNKSDIQLLTSLAENNGAHDIKIIQGQEDYAYYATWLDGKIGIINLTDDVFTLVNETSLSDVFYINPNNISGDNIVFAITHSDDSFHIYNMTNNQIVQLDNISGNDTNYDIINTWRVKYHPEYKFTIVTSLDNVDYIGGNCTNVFNVTDLSNIVPINKYCGGYWGLTNINIEGNKLYGTDGQNDRIIVSQINSNGTLTYLGNYTNSDLLDNTHGIDVENDIIYVDDWFQGKLSVLNATDPTDITLISSITTPTINNHAVIKEGDYIFNAAALDTISIYFWNLSEVNYYPDWNSVEASGGYGNWSLNNGKIRVESVGNTLSYLYYNSSLGVDNYSMSVLINSEDGLTTTNYQNGIKFDNSLSDSSRGYFRWIDLTGYDKWYIDGESASSTSSADTDFDARVQHKYEFIKSGTNWTGYVDDDLKVSRTEDWSAQYVGLYIYAETSGHWVDYDNVYVRKYASPEPVVYYNQDGLSDNSSWANVTKTLNDTVGISIGYRWYLTDNDDNENNTEIFSLTTTDTTSPVINQLNQTNETGIINGTVLQNDNVTFSVNATDDTEVSNVWVTIWQGVIGGPIWLIQQLVDLGSGIWEGNVTTNNSLGSGDTNYTIYVNDTSGNEANESSNFTVIGTDTCTYSSGNWEVDCSDDCVITENVDVSGNNISITGTGTFTTSANISNYEKLHIEGTDTSNICRVTCISGGCFK